MGFDFGPERDFFLGGPHRQNFDGGEGTDVVNYSRSPAAVDIDLTQRGENATRESPERSFARGDSLTSIEEVWATEYDDRIVGDAVPERLFGNGGNDTLRGGGGGDHVRGGSGDDELWGDGGADTVYGDQGTDWLAGGRGSDILWGGKGNDVLRGEWGDDVLEGGAGADRLEGWGVRKGGPDGSPIPEPGDNVFGDTAAYTRSNAAVIIDLGATGGPVATGGHAEGDTLIDIENVRGSSHHDWLTGDSEDNALYGNQGDDLLVGGAGDDALFGGRGSDTLRGGTGDDLLEGGAGPDRIEGGEHGAYAYSGDWASYRGSHAGVTVDLGAPGDPTATGGHAHGDVLVDIEHVAGSDHDDRLVGAAARNSFRGGRGNDTLVGGAGDDSLRGGLGDDRLYGATGADSLYGDAGNDRLVGGVGDDLLFGGAGADRLHGGMGNDTLVGWSGADVFVFDMNDGNDTDTISDFENNVDRIDLRAYGLTEAQLRAAIGIDPIGVVVDLSGYGGGKIYVDGPGYGADNTDIDDILDDFIL